MNWPRKLGVVLVAAGALLLAVYLVPTAYGTMMARIAVARFHALNSTNNLWDPARVLAYRRTLAVSLPPPEAVLRIPRLGIEVPVLEGTSDLTLNRGLGHIPGSALPGQPGNLAIAGHRDGFFRSLKDVVPGDRIDVEFTSPAGVNPRLTDHYIVRNIKVVFPSDTSVLNSTADATLTLVTCYPFYFIGAAPERYIVQASLLSATARTATPDVTKAHPTLSGD